MYIHVCLFLRVGGWGGRKRGRKRGRKKKKKKKEDLGRGDCCERISVIRGFFRANAEENGVVGEGGVDRSQVVEQYLD